MIEDRPGATFKGPMLPMLDSEFEVAKRESLLLASKLQFLTNAVLTLASLSIAYFLIPNLHVLTFMALLGWVVLWTLVVIYLVSRRGLEGAYYPNLLRLGLFCTVLTVALLAYLLGQAESDFYLIYFVPLITAGVYFGIRGALFAATVSGLAYFGMAYFSVPMTSDFLYTLALRILFFFLTAGLLGLLAESESEVLAKVLLAYDRARQLAIIDSLTGVYNRRLLEIWLQHEMARTGRYGSWGSCMMLDLDGFKEYNDRYGHAGGDQVLKKLGSILKSNSRGNDVVSRYGGDEFVLLLPDTNAQQAMNQADRLRVAIKTAFAEDQGGKVTTPITISAGIAQYPKDAKDVAELLEKADKATYAAKSGGGDKVCLWEQVSGLDEPEEKRS